MVIVDKERKNMQHNENNDILAGKTALAHSMNEFGMAGHQHPLHKMLNTNNGWLLLGVNQDNEPFTVADFFKISQLNGRKLHYLLTDNFILALQGGIIKKEDIFSIESPEALGILVSSDGRKALHTLLSIDAVKTYLVDNSPKLLRNPKVDSLGSLVMAAGRTVLEHLIKSGKSVQEASQTLLIQAKKMDPKAFHVYLEENAKLFENNTENKSTHQVTPHTHSGK
jgi:hypothetical protein